MEISSSAFNHNEPIPKKYTCDGDDVSPPLQVKNVPTGSQTFAIIVDDPDAPMGTFDHWIAWNIPASQTSLQEGGNVPNQGTNDFHQRRYRGPCPPPGNKHRYFFKFYALDTILDLQNGASKEDLESAMEGHIIGQAELVATYQRSR